jgi:hypothetical protein
VQEFVLQVTVAESANAELAPYLLNSRIKHASLRPDHERSVLYRYLREKVKYSSLAASRFHPYSVPAETSEMLPFKVRLVDTTKDLDRAVEIRSSAYSRHVPSVGRALREAEADDHRSDVLLMIAERKADRRVLGSVRMQPNLNQPLRIEGEANLPEMFHDRRLIEFMRLGVENGISGLLVTSALVKAGYEICHAAGIEFVLVAGRRSVATIYRSMCFDDVLDGGTVPLSYADRLQHGIFSMPIEDADNRWKSRGHALYDFMARTEHPDIDIDYKRVFDTFGSR